MNERDNFQSASNFHDPWLINNIKLSSELWQFEVWTDVIEGSKFSSLNCSIQIPPVTILMKRRGDIKITLSNGVISIENPSGILPELLCYFFYVPMARKRSDFSLLIESLF
jgi:hypothetical protein